MSNLRETSLVIKKETIYDKIRKSLFMLVYGKDYQMMKRLDDLIKSNRLQSSSEIIIPKEIGKNKKGGKSYE